MTVSFELPTDLEERLRQEARRAGLDLGEYVRRFLADHLRTTNGAGGNGSNPAPVPAPANGIRLGAREADLLRQINLGQIGRAHV